jgi:gamma-glutamylcyclotransferase (GGCT)/AIG2-like uncharacterized protein YtfP
MQLRCPSARLCGRAELNRHRFFIMREGYASIARDATASVYGLLWAVSCSDIAALDHYEEVSTGLYQKRIVAVRFRGSARPALLYWGRSKLPGTPRPAYMQGIVAAAARANLPSAYQRALSHFLLVGSRINRCGCSAIAIEHSR